MRLYPRLIALLSIGLIGCTSQPSTPESPPNPPAPSASPSAQATPSPSASPVVASETPPPAQEVVDPQPTSAIALRTAPIGTDDQGNYRRTSHLTWEVVDPDPAGLNCRWSDEMPVEWYSPDAQLPPMTVGSWPVVKTFAPGTILRANITPAGFSALFDENRQPWLKVSLGDNDEICLVRANQRFVRPVLPQANQAGDFAGPVWQDKWKVVDPDPAGLNCRWSEKMPPDWQATGAQLPRLEVDQWPVVARFEADEILFTQPDAANLVTLQDVQGRPWLKVKRWSETETPGNETCLVRANQRYIQPLLES